jgi:hypothetical protein
LRRIIWLASYPKSGNTWFRLLIANLRAEQPVDINDLRGLGGIASSRVLFDEQMLFPAGLLTHEECDRLRPCIYEALTRGTDPLVEPGQTDTVRFIKTHDAWTRTGEGKPLLGGRDVASGAILIVRDPRAVAASLAYHSHQTTDETIAFMANPQATFCGQTDRQHNQLRQQLPGWSGYHRSWLGQRDLPLHLVRYEELHADTAGTLQRALAFAGMAVTAHEVAQAVRFADFAALQEQERAKGFREAPPEPQGHFFRRGLSAGWRDELTPEQIARIGAEHAGMMARLGYGPARDTGPIDVPALRGAVGLGSRAVLPASCSPCCRPGRAASGSSRRRPQVWRRFGSGWRCIPSAGLFGVAGCRPRIHASRPVGRGPRLVRPASRGGSAGRCARWRPACRSARCACNRRSPLMRCCGGVASPA